MHLILALLLVGGSSDIDILPHRPIVSQTEPSSPAKMVKPPVSKSKAIKKVPHMQRPSRSKSRSRESVGPSGIASCIAKYESGGNPRAENPRSTASGLYQFIDGTWNKFGGYSRAKDAPVAIQTKKFYQVWDHGRGARNWVVSPRCGY
jgi:hypothetical protein